jgi:hypothetical protein
MRRIADSHRLDRHGFGRALWILGIEQDKSTYRSLRRLWYIATNPTACRLIDREFVRLRVFKREGYMRPMQLSKKAALIEAGIKDYIDALVRDDRSGLKVPPIQLKGYKESRIEQIIRDVDYYNVAHLTRQTDSHHFRPYALKVENDIMSIPADKINFKSPKIADFKKAVEIYWKLRYAADSLEKYIITRRPLEPGGELQSSEHTPGSPRYQEDYSKFIVDNCLEAFCNIDAVSRIIFEWEAVKNNGTKKKAQLLLAEKDAARFKRKKDRQAAMTRALIERSKKERAEKAKADHAASQDQRDSDEADSKAAS